MVNGCILPSVFIINISCNLDCTAVSLPNSKDKMKHFRRTFVKQGAAAVSYRKLHYSRRLLVSLYQTKCFLMFCFCTWLFCATSLLVYMENSEPETYKSIRSVLIAGEGSPMIPSRHEVEKNIQWIIPVYKCAWSLDIVLQSYVNANILQNVTIFKHAKSAKIDAVIRKYGSQIQLDIVDNSFAWTRFTQENDNGETFGNPLTDMTKCSKHYWWWMMDITWASSDVVCVMADDMVVRRQTRKWIQKGLSVMNSGHIGFKLHDMNNVTFPLCMRAYDWSQIKIRKREFFDINDFKWDQVIARIFLKNKTFLVPSVPLTKAIKNMHTESKVDDRKEKASNWSSQAVLNISFKNSLMLPHFSGPIGDLGHTHCMKERHCPYLRLKQVAEGVWRSGKDDKNNDKFTIAMQNVGLDMSRVKVTHGGENVSLVVGRKDSLEFPKYANDAWTVPYKPSVKLSSFTYQANVFKSAMIGKPSSCDKVFDGTTVVFERGDYANFYHVVVDWYNMHSIYNQFNLTAARIMWLDGHPKGHFDDVWPVAFNSQIDRIGAYNDTLCFDHIIWMPFGNPIYHHEAVDGCTINDFVRRLKRSFNVKPTGEKYDTIIERRPYLSHPRTDGKSIDRVLKNMDEVSRAFPAARIIRLELLTFKEQLQVIVNTKTLYGVHGAGLSWGLFLEPGSKMVEWVPKSREKTLSFQQFASWRPDLMYERVQLKPVIGDKRSWILPIERKGNNTN